jgi:hypothetical protein
MALVEQWHAIENGLDPRWRAVELLLTGADETRSDRTAALLAPAGPGRSGNTLRFTAVRGGAGVGPEALRRLLRRLDGEGIDATLELVSVDAAPREPAAAPPSIAADWDDALAALPADWSDLLCELELTSSDHLGPAALRLGPVNPLQTDGMLGFRFRVARSFGYGASSGMVRRCVARLDEAAIPGRVRVLRVLSDTHPVGTQGPVWYVGGKAV